jgi:hypothetical protein
MGRILLFLGAALLLTTAVIHALGQPMIDGWLDGLSHKQKAAICLVWVTDSISWAVVAALWAIAGWKPQPAWKSAAAVACAIPAITAAGIIAIDATFFGAWMLVGSVALATVGLVLFRRSPT